MNIEYKGVLSSLGYDIESRGAILFGDLIDDVRELLKEGKTEEEIRELLPRYYLEYYHFCYEIGRKRYLSELEQFCASRAITKKNMAKNKEIMKLKSNMNLENSLLFFAKYFNQLEQKTEERKVYVYKIDGNQV